MTTTNKSNKANINVSANINASANINTSTNINTNNVANNAVNHISNNPFTINADDVTSNNANNIANAAGSRAFRLGFVEALAGILVAAAGLKWSNKDLTHGGMGCVRDGLGDVMSAMEAGQMDQAQIQRQESCIATYVLNVIWPYIEYYGHRAWVLYIRPCGQTVWEGVLQQCGLRRTERVLCE